MSNNDKHSDYLTSDPNIWGPHFWFVIHTVMANYPEKPTSLDQEIMSGFIKSIPFLLPCDECYRSTFFFIKEHIDEIPELVKDRRKLVHFFKVYHDKVNEKLGKKQMYIISREEYIPEFGKQYL